MSLELDRTVKEQGEKIAELEAENKRLEAVALFLAGGLSTHPYHKDIPAQQLFEEAEAEVEKIRIRDAAGGTAAEKPRRPTPRMFA